MEQEQVRLKIFNVLSDNHGIDGAQELAKDPDVSVDDLGFDSLDDVEFLMGIEEEFSIDIEDSEVVGLRSLSSIIDYVTSLVTGE